MELLMFIDHCLLIGAVKREATVQKDRGKDLYTRSFEVMLRDSRERLSESCCFVCSTITLLLLSHMDIKSVVIKCEVKVNAIH